MIVLRLLISYMGCVFSEGRLDLAHRDIDQDGITIAEGDCWESSTQPPLVSGAQSHRLSSVDIHPGAYDAPYDGIDANCDGKDDFDQDEDGFVPNEYQGIGTLQVVGSGHLPSGDCWDWTGDVLTDDWIVAPGFTQLTAEMVFPGAYDTAYDGIDANCDGKNDFDQDEDGWALEVDCDDWNPAIPSEEIPIDGIDQDCDGFELCFVDRDGDGIGVEQLDDSLDWLCQNDGFSIKSDDCDDENPYIYPYATELCDGLINDCNRVELPQNERDQDGDGYVSCTVVEWQGDEAIIGGDDCDDDNADFFPNQYWYLDQDGDGFANDSSDYQMSCAPSGLYQAQQVGDCDDDNPNIYPYATELLDAQDENCDALETQGIFCEGGWLGSGYFLTCEQSFVQTQAHQVCIDNGYDGLLSIRNVMEKTFIEQSLKSSHYWIGLSDRVNEGSFQWLDGYAHHQVGNWASNEPNNGWFWVNGSMQFFGEEDCVIVNTQGQWFDISCGSAKPFICQRRF